MLSPTADLLGAAFAYVLPAGIAASPAHRALRIHKRLRDRARVALTFDDGPQPRVVDQFLRLLNNQGVRATFFVVGIDVREDPDIVREMHAAGHEIANHGYTHRNHLLRNPLAIKQDIERGADIIENATGVRPEMYRPCYGVVTAATRYGAWRSHSSLVLWSRWGKDWQPDATIQSIVENATRHVAGGDIILLHDADHYGTVGSWKKTLASLPAIIDRITALGLEASPIGGTQSL